MLMLAIPFPNIDPVLMEFGPLAVRWYSLSYVLGIVLGWLLLHRLNKYQPAALTEKAMENLMIWAIFGIILGGRLGYVLFYNPGYYLENPGDILKIWQGGMSFHGGMIGVITALFLLCKTHKIVFWPVIDLVACVAPIGLFLGRIANFINAELYGRITDVSWGVIFPGDPFARHPSQLYQAALEGLALFVLLNLAVRSEKIRSKPGTLSGLFLVGYASARTFVELFREPDAQIGYLAGVLTMGQILCIPMFLLGGYLILRERKKA